MRPSLVVIHFSEWTPVFKLCKIPGSSLPLTYFLVIFKCHSREEGKEKTAFRVLGSLYETERVTFQLYSTPLTFSRLMDKNLW